ncbi:hypothetical protein J7E93_15755 [Streptomyces sp. ISL-36]|uniref:hypothetical protein n=1 Tax=Streptomyces sp. ISL-36 TaxID=2819182 RepID=UPI001BE6C6E0|nr:hypothetical protein [Streptomyces sp. ISL-36]MBT2441543.1 hypothetical protein [Streptomyces sp. ISL-36]
MSFGGPQWPQEPQQHGQQHGQQQPYGQQPNPFPGAQAPDTPDWGALADASAAGRRRKRWLIVGGGALATLAVGAIVATAVVSGGDGDDTAKNGSVTPTGSTAPSDSPTPEPTFSSVAPPPPPNPKDFISNETKDKAPLSAEGLFPGKKLTMSGRAYTKGATSSTTDCASVAQGALGSILKKNGCDRVLRATYVKDGVAITVGVAVFSTEAEASSAKVQAKGGIAPLAGSGVADFCRATVCLRRSNSIGRYAYFTQAGFTDGKKVTESDRAIYQASDDLGTFTFNQIYTRGRTQASAAAGAPGE